MEGEAMPQPCLKQFPKILQTKVNSLQTYRGNKSCTSQTCHLLKVICCFLPLNSSAVFKRCTSPFDLFIYPVQRGKKEKYKRWEWGDDVQTWARREVTEEDADESRDVESRRVETRHWLHVVKVQNAWCRGSKSPDKSHAPRAHQDGWLKKCRWKWWCFCPNHLRV